MPFDLSWEADGVYKKFSGAVSADEIARSVDLVSADQRFDNLKYAIHDFTDVSKFDIDEANAKRFAGSSLAAEMAHPHLIRAMVARDSDLVDLIGRLGIPLEVNVFLSLEDARTWIKRRKAQTGSGF